MKEKIGAKNRHIEIPEGYRILSGEEQMKEGDLVANIYTIRFERIDKEDVGLEAGIYDLVIRGKI